METISQELNTVASNVTVPELSENQTCVRRPLLLLVSTTMLSYGSLYILPIFQEFKMIFVGCVGASVALLSFVNNLILLHAFVTSRRAMNARRNLTYLTCLSVCDILISFFYVFIMSAQVYAEYFPIRWLFAAWHMYLPLAFTFSNVAISAASFLLVAAAVERYLLTISSAKRTLRFMLENRRHVALFAVLLAVLMKGTIIFEIEVYYNAECGDSLAARGVLLSEMARHPVYDSIWRFWTRRIVTIFLPFFLLAYCNLAIVFNIERTERQRTRIHRAKNVVTAILTKKPTLAGAKIPNHNLLKTHNLLKALAHKQDEAESERLERVRRRVATPRVRAATRMLIIVVACYLVANVLDVFLAAWEYYDSESLAQMSSFYTVATDVSSLLSVLSSAFRLPIYFFAGDKLLRAEIWRSLCALRGTLLCASSRYSEMGVLDKVRDTFFLPYQPMMVIVRNQDTVTTIFSEEHIL